MNDLLTADDVRWLFLQERLDMHLDLHTKVIRAAGDQSTTHTAFSWHDLELDGLVKETALQLRRIDLLETLDKGQRRSSG